MIFIISSLIDLIVIIRKDFVIFLVVVFLGLFDYNLIYVILCLKNKRFLLIIIKIRDYKKFDEMVFYRDIFIVLFDVGFVFDDFDDRLWVW